MEPKRNGFYVHLLRDGGRPYQVWGSDLWSCRSCGTEVAVGFGNAPVAEHFESEKFFRALKFVDIEVG